MNKSVSRYLAGICSGDGRICDIDIHRSYLSLRRVGVVRMFRRTDTSECHGDIRQESDAACNLRYFIRAKYHRQVNRI